MVERYHVSENRAIAKHNITKHYTKGFSRVAIVF